MTKVMDTGLKILHLENMEADIVQLQNTLKQDSDTYQIQVVKAESTFKTALSDFLPDIILASDEVPLFSATEVWTTLRHTGLTIPFIILTREISELHAIKLVKEGADDYIFKDRLNRLPVAISQAVQKFSYKLERQLITDELVSSEKRYRALIESSTDAVVILNADAHPTYVSSSVNMVLGYSSEEIMQMDLFSIMHPDDITATALILEKVLANPGVPIKGHTGRMLHKDGSWRWIEATVTNFLDDPAINGIVDNFRDITESKLAEERYRLLFETSMDGILLTMKNGNVLAANEAACAIFNMTADELISARTGILVDFEDPSLSALLLEREQTGRATGELTFKRKDGSEFPGEISSTIFKDAHGSNNTSMIIRDISARKAAERQLYESEQFNKGILASLTAHIAVIDHSGNLIAVNKAWNDFANANEVAVMQRAPKGANYFEVCKKEILAGATDAAKALAGILSVFNKDSQVFELEYACHTPTERRWFVLHAMSFGDDDTKVVISHQNITALKITEEKLVQSESRLKQAQTIAQIGSWEANLKTSALIWSEETYRIFGVNQTDFIPDYQLFLGLVHPDDRLMVDEAIKSANGTEALSTIEHRIITPFGIEKVVEENWKIITDTDGETVLAIGSCQEITQRKKADELVKNAVSNLNAIIENTDAFIYSLDRNFNYLTFNSKLQASLQVLYGITICPGHNVFELISSYDPGGVQEWNDIYSRVLAGETMKFEREFLSDETYTYTSFSINPMWKDETVIGLSCYVHDITEEKRANEQNKFQAYLLDSIGQAAIATNLRGNVTFWNKAAEQIYGWGANEALHKDIMDLIPTRGSHKRSLQIMALLRTGQSWSGELEVQRKNGTYFPASITNSPIYDQHHQLSGMIGVSSDITEKRALEERLESTSVLARIGNYEFDLVKNVVSWSPMARTILGTKKDFIPDVESTLALFARGNSRDTISEAFYQAKENGTAFDLELQINTADNRSQWVRIIGQAECIDNECIRIYGSLQDIDKMKIAELEILKVYEEKNVILESIGDAFFAVDHNWIISYWNSTAEKVLGKTKFQTYGRNLWEVFSDAIDSESHAQYQRAIENNKAVHFEDYYPTLDQWYEISAYPSDTVLSVYIKDISERKRTLAALEESERNYSGLFHLSPLPMWVFDQDTLRFLDVNEAAIKSYGYSLSEFLNMTIIDIRPEQDLTKLDEILEKPTEPDPKLISQGIFRHKKKDGTMIQVEIQSNFIRFRGKRAKMVIASDMTERYNYIESIEDQNAKLKEIAWIQSHVVRAPLARIMALIPMISDKDASGEEREIAQNYLQIAARELDGAIKNIADKTR